MNVLITGGTSGIGLALAEIFAKEKNNLIIVSRTKNDLEKIKEFLEEKYKINVMIISKDLCQENAGKEIYDEIKKQSINIDILINNAGFATYGNYIDLEYQKQKDLAGVNIIALMELSYFFGKDMVKRRKGRILNMASIAAFQLGPFMAMYYSSKAFVLSFSQALAKEFENTGVTVTVLCPGPTKTNFEQSAGMKKSFMFNKLKVDTSRIVAEEGYKALMKGKVICVTGIQNKIITFLTRITSKKLNRNIAYKINKGKSTENRVI